MGGAAQLCSIRVLWGFLRVLIRLLIGFGFGIFSECGPKAVGFSSSWF